MSNISGHGGAREGAGRPPGSAAATPGRAGLKAEFDAEKVRHERIKADRAEHQLNVLRGRYIERTAVIEASATAVGVLVQSLRGIRDGLERKFRLEPEVLDAVAAEIDAALESAGHAFKALEGKTP